MNSPIASIDDRHFADYTQLSAYLPLRVWQVLRAGVLLAAIGMAVLLWMRPAVGLAVLWGLAVPMLPLVFFVAPGVWRNLCPLATANQIPRLFGITRGTTQPLLSQGAAYPFGIALFFVLVTSRKLLFDSSGVATALLIVSGIVFAFVGGLFFKGKSGWCSSLCPMLPVQRIYGQTPFIKVANTHCQPCMGCTKNCYDFAPGSAYLADQYDDNTRYSGYRRFFAGVFPGFVLAFYLVPDPPAIAVDTMVWHMLVYMAVSLALFHTLETLVRTTYNSMPVVFAAAAINIYYWFSGHAMMQTLHQFGVPAAEPMLWVIRATVLGVSGLWIWRSLLAERRYLVQLMEQSASGAITLSATAANTIRQFSRALHGKAQAGTPTPAQANGEAGTRAPQNVVGGKVEVRIDPKGKSIAIQPGLSVLEAVESCGVDIEAGCRMGICGVDPIAITNGIENLSAVGKSERATLERLGYAQNTRMACSARVRGSIVMELKPHRQQQVAAPPTAVAAVEKFDAAIKSVVIVGNGIAGLTAADHVRRRHPACEIHVIGREKHHPYNRMSVPKLIYGRSGMQGLYLLSEAWYDEHRITCWLNTHVVALDHDKRRLALATGEELVYDRLILATGSSGFVPSIKGFGASGTFVLRDADEAMGLREHTQRHRAKNAVIAGAGLLGLEAAYALHKLGVHVTVLANSEWVMNRQLDARAGELVRQYFERLGITICTQARASYVHKNRQKRVSRIDLEDGRKLACDIFMVCAGVQPNVELAQAAGIAVNRGILVDERMETNVAHVYAAGDVAEFDGETFGLWPVAVEQGEVAAINLLGGERRYAGFVSSTLLKVVGIDLMSAGRFNTRADDEIEIVHEDDQALTYRKLVIAGGRLVGAIMIGHPSAAATVSALVKTHADVSRLLEPLRRGEWEGLSALHEQAA